MTIGSANTFSAWVIAQAVPPPAIPGMSPLSEGWRIGLIVCLALGALVLVLIARWGYRNAEQLVPTSYSASGQRRRAKSLRHGAVMCCLAAFVLLVAMLLLVFGQVR